jgi:aerobic carbon-monoxide dehydrogenase large subunit
MSVSDYSGEGSVLDRENSFIGKSVPRANAARLVAGQGKYVDDLTLPRMVHVVYYRSPYAHARIISIDDTAALACPGVIRVITGKEVAEVCTSWVGTLAHFKGMKSAPQHALAIDRACWQGEPIAGIVANSRAEAEDAMQLLEVEFEELPALADPEVAMDSDTPVMHPDLGDNLLFEMNHDIGDTAAAFEKAHTVVERTLHFGRHTGVCPESRAIIADYHSSEHRLTAYHSHQAPHMMQDLFARHLDIPNQNVRIVCGDVGGAYGVKGHTYPDEMATAAISLILKRPVKFIADRIESFLTDLHARDHRATARAAFAEDGELLAIEMDDLTGVGAYSMYPRTSALEALQVINYVGAPYTHKNYKARSRVVFQNKTPMSQYRAVGHPVAVAITETLIEEGARALKMDPLDVRRRNLMPDDGYPCEFITGLKMEGLSHQASLDKLTSMFDYKGFREEQERLRGEGIYRGIGFAALVEMTNPGPHTYGLGGARISSQDGAAARMDASGAVVIQTSITEQGQGSEAVIQQVTASAFGTTPDKVKVISGDTDNVPVGWGAGGSGGAGIAGEAALQAAKALRHNVLDVAAILLQVEANTLDIRTGVIVDRATGDERMPIEEVARVAYFRPDTLPQDFQSEMMATRHYIPKKYPVAMTNSFQAVTVEVDPEIGTVKLLNYWCVEDCGKVINPLLVDEQVRGSIVQGIGGVLYEECRYDKDGNFLNANMADYLVPMAGEMPDIEIGHIETLTRESELGAKGAGEAGTAGAPGAILNAINDALSPFGAAVWRQPVSPEQVLKALGKY